MTPGDAPDSHGLEVAPEKNLDHSPGKLAMTLERCDPHCRCASEPCCFQQRHQLYGNDPEYEAIEGHDQGKEANADNPHPSFEHGTFWRGGASRCCHLALLRISACQTKPVERQANDEVDHCKDD